VKNQEGATERKMQIEAKRPCCREEENKKKMVK
jgi:hypothetical protein